MTSTHVNGIGVSEPESAERIRTKMCATRTALVLACSLLFFACSQERGDARIDQSAAAHLKPRTTALPEPTVRRTVYVPVYSSISVGLDIRQKMIDLAATVSVRNVSPR